MTQQVQVGNPFLPAGQTSTLEAQSIADELQCTICFSAYMQCMITPCGHNFCNTCIRDWLKQQQTCPLCKQHLQEKQLIRNYSMDRLILLFEKAVANQTDTNRAKQQEIMQKLLKQEEQDSNDNKMFLETRQKLEEIFRHAMEKSLFQFQTKHKELFSQYASSKTALKMKYSQQINQVYLQESDPQVSAAKTKKMQFECEVECGKVFTKFCTDLKTLMQSYETYMVKDDFKPPVQQQVLTQSVTHVPVMQASTLAQSTSVVAPTNTAATCFTLTFNKNSNTTTSFYLCNTCKLNCMHFVFVLLIYRDM